MIKPIVIVILTNPDRDFTKIVFTILGTALFLFPFISGSSWSDTKNKTVNKKP